MRSIRRSGRSNIQTSSPSLLPTATANLALVREAIWDKYQLNRLAGDKFKSNSLIVEQKAAGADARSCEDPVVRFSGADNSIPALMRRGVVFMSCHNAIWEQVAALIKADVNPDKLSHAALAADLTNHLANGVVLIPGALVRCPSCSGSSFFMQSNTEL